MHKHETLEENDCPPEARALSKSYEADSSLDQRGRRFKSCESFDNRSYRGPDLSVGTKVDRYKLLAPNQRIPEGGLSEINDIDSSSSISAPYGGGAVIGPGGVATPELRMMSRDFDSRSSRQSYRRKGGVQREIKVAFTEFHNSSGDTKSAFLGDEKSIAGGKIFVPMSQENRLGGKFYIKSVPVSQCFEIMFFISDDSTIKVWN